MNVEDTVDDAYKKPFYDESISEYSRFQSKLNLLYHRLNAYSYFYQKIFFKVSYLQNKLNGQSSSNI